MQISRNILLTHNVHMKSPILNIAWWTVFRKRKKSPPPKNQPPTDCNAFIHILGVQGQCHVWKGADKPDPPCRHPCPWLGDEGRSSNASHLCSTNCPSKASCHCELPKIHATFTTSCYINSTGLETCRWNQKRSFYLKRFPRYDNFSKSNMAAVAILDFWENR